MPRPDAISWSLYCGSTPPLYSMDVDGRERMRLELRLGKIVRDTFRTLSVVRRLRPVDLGAARLRTLLGSRRRAPRILCGSAHEGLRGCSPEPSAVDENPATARSIQPRPKGIT